ncbi:MAG TPA: competence/damage-inducible protein A [Vicinamibacterales bacterium]|nr:competence/damage-inducible protein A [Vicinamibacterales bacterium]
MNALRAAEILAVGSELLTPFRIDTNSLYLTGQLNELGIDVRNKGVVGDAPADIRARVLAALERADIVITSGGLGPTADDLTRETVAAALGLTLAEDATVLAAIRKRFERRGLQMPDGNRRQAAVPAGASVLPNPNGTAPGLWIESGGKIVVLLPGPPRELQHIFETDVKPRIAARSSGARVLRRVVKITGRAESIVDDVAQPIYGPLAAAAIPIETSILASPGQIELHLSARGEDIAAMERALQDGVDRLAAALAPAVFSTDGRTLDRVVGDALLANRSRIAVAESCTGGLLGGRLTEVPGSSAWFVGGVIAYDNAVKTRELGVPDDLISAHGVVSEPVARAMAEGVRRRFGTEFGLSVTGIAGPDGGSAEKPVGTVAIALAGPGARARVFRFVGDRQMIRQQSVLAALEMVRQALGGL